MKKIFILFLFLSILTGCSGYHTIVSELISRDSSIVRISPEEFESLHNLENSMCSYMGNGQIGKLRSSRVDFLEPKFEAILYNPKDSIVYIRGILNSSNKPFSSGQIIIGWLPNMSSTSNVGKIHMLYDYVIPGNGKFSVAIPIDDDSLQIVFASRDMYTEEGEYEYTPFAFIKTYDVYKLRDMHRG